MINVINNFVFFLSIWSKEFNDTIADLKKQLNTETQEDNKDLQIQELKDLVY